ncbi:MAG: PSD1 and planctomycete cytochrome C domain-containing protein, partial [Planctomycetota bacterium]|nr:PSD1 and planctomycete cytochrome C domain-containing protein [Planctomycetota bacterium]
MRGSVFMGAANRFIRLIPLVAALPFLIGVGTSFADEPVSLDPASEAFFTTRVVPILRTRCLECHSHATGKSKGGLMLDSRSGWERGGDTGPAIVPGKPDESLVIQAVRYGELKMPPTGKLPPDELATLELWVKGGAVDPRQISADPPATAVKPGTDHWAFRPVTITEPPAVQKADWPTGPLDRFVLAAQESHQLVPSADADRATWLRRVSFDLVGLPPTPEELAAFLADQSPMAHEAVVDRLLSSRGYGERWARHWLDLVGYADQIGTSNNMFAEHAWRYRDYVIQSLNRDLPYDRFLREQIAGDLLPANSPEERATQIVATGFLVLGDLSVVEADKAKLRVDVVDQQIDKIGKAMLGMTLACARCHDHKFDPISQRDYYALAGILFSTQTVERAIWGVWSFPVVVDLPETADEKTDRARRLVAHQTLVTGMKREQEQARKRVAEIQSALAPNAATAVDEATRAALEKEKQQLEGTIRNLDARIVHAEFFAPQTPRAFAVREEPQLRDMRITIRGNAHALGEEIPRGFPAVLRNGSELSIPAYQSGRKELADWISSPKNPLTARVAVNRIWQKLFGEGLVRSVDYFGVRGETPSHPELLDWLANRFVEVGWSQKRFLRELVLSRTYRQSSVPNSANEAIDAENRWLWRMNRRRLDAEALRDALVAVSGKLALQTGGPGLPLE